MHELSIARQLLDIVAEAATQHELKRVRRLRVVVGALGNVVPEALEFAFDVAGEGTVAAGAELEIVEVPVTVRCNACGAESRLEDFAFLCPACGSLDVTVLKGNELYLDSIEGEENNGTGPTDD